MTGAGIILYACNLKPAEVARSSVFNGGVVGVMVTFGLAWMADVFFAGHRAELVGMFGEFVQTYPWTFCIVLFMGAAVLTSQGATLLPTNPIMLAVCGFDRSGTSSVGKYVFDNPFAIWDAINLLIQVIIGFIIISFL